MRAGSILTMKPLPPLTLPGKCIHCSYRTKSWMMKMQKDSRLIGAHPGHPRMLARTPARRSKRDGNACLLRKRRTVTAVSKQTEFHNAVEYKF